MEYYYSKSMGLGETLDASVRLYRKNFRTLIVAQLPLTLFYLGYNLFCFYTVHDFTFFSIYGHPFHDFLMGHYFDDDLSFFKDSVLPSLIHMAVVYPVTVSAVTRIATNSMTKGSSLKDAYTFSVRNWWKLAVINSVVTLALGALVYVSLTLIFPIISFIVGIRSEIVSILLLLVFFVGLLPAFFLWTQLTAVYPIMVYEEKFGKAIQRSWNLVRGYTLKVFFVMSLVLFISLGIMFSSYIFVELLETSSIFVLVSLLLVSGAAVQGLFIPWLDCTRVVIYFNLRTRKEGFDLEQRVENLQ